MKIRFVIISFFITAFSIAQEGTNFSMWFLNPMQHNPAGVGTNNNNLRASANFRYQYFTLTDQPYQTLSATVEAKLYPLEKVPGYFGVGGSFVNNRSGEGKYTVNDLDIPIAYHLPFDEKHTLSLGVAPGIYQRSAQSDRYKWESQWTGADFDISNSPTGDFEKSKMNFDLGAGIYYNYQASRTNKVYAGLSARHLITPDVGYEIRDDLSRRYIAQFGMSHKFYRRDFGISPQIIGFYQAPIWSFTVGTNFDFYLQDPSRQTIFYTPTIFSFGVYHRWMEGIIVNAQLMFRGVTIALAYDSNINSMIQHTKSVGALEVAFQYDIIFNKKEKFIY